MMGACHCVYGYFAGPTVTVVIESLTSSKVSRRLSVLQTTMEFQPTCSKGATAPTIPCILVFHYWEIAIVSIISSLSAITLA